MKLLIEAGNSRIKTAFVDESSNELIRPASFYYHGQQLNHEMVQHWEAWTPPTEVYLASVAEEDVQHIIARWVREHWHCTVHFVNSLPQAGGVINGYALPATLGVDRFLAMVAAWQRYPNQPLIVVDCGTATTIDYIDKTGMHVGGMIVPGLHTLAVALQQTTQIKLASGFQPGRLKLTLGRNTADAISQGIYWQTVDFVNVEIQKLLQKTTAATRCLLTGGGADLIVGDIQHPVELVPDLVLLGLHAIAIASTHKST